MNNLESFSNYECTKNGEVVNVCTGRVLKPFKSKSGYLNVYIYSDEGKKKGFRVNRLVAISHIDNPNNKPQVNHIDGNKLNNTVKNLEWVTPKENMQHAHKTGLINPKKGKEHKRSKPIKCYHPNGEVTIHDNSRFLCKELNLHRGSVMKCLNGSRRHHKNYKFEFA
jgi:hypothetical protein